MIKKTKRYFENPFLPPNFEKVLTDTLNNNIMGVFQGPDLLKMISQSRNARPALAHRPRTRLVQSASCPAMWAGVFPRASSVTASSTVWMARMSLDAVSFLFHPTCFINLFFYSFSFGM